MKFHHELKYELKQRYEKYLTNFESHKDEYNILYHIASEYVNLYPGVYHYLGEVVLSLGIPNNMSIKQFNDYLDYIEAEYLIDYNLLRNEQYDSTITIEYEHKETKKHLEIHFYNNHCRTIKTGKLIEETITKCTWGE